MANSDHNRFRSARDDAHRALNSLSVDGHELLRRAAIPAGGDGFPPRASGADRASFGRTELREQIVVFVLRDGVHYGWRCSCGDDNTARSDGLPAVDGHSTSARAFAAGNHHALVEHGGGRAIDYSDPTGDSVANGTPADPARALAGQMLRAIDSHARSLSALAAQVSAFLAERPSSSTLDDPGCESCARMLMSNGQPTWVPSLAKGDVGGRLTDARHLCRWCRDYVAVNDKLPSRDEVRAHNEGRRVRVSA